MCLEYRGQETHLEGSKPIGFNWKERYNLSWYRRYGVLYMEKISIALKWLKFIYFDADKKLQSFWVLWVHVEVENNTTDCI